MITTPYEIAYYAGNQWGCGGPGVARFRGNPQFFGAWLESEDIDLSILIYIPQVPFDPRYSFAAFNSGSIH
jgi:hypothetical protein